MLSQKERKKESAGALDYYTLYCALLKLNGQIDMRSARQVASEDVKETVL